MDEHVILRCNSFVGGKVEILYTINQNLSNNCSAVKEEKIKITFSVLESTARMGKGLLFLKGYSFSFDVICEMKYYYKGGEPMRWWTNYKDEE